MLERASNSDVLVLAQHVFGAHDEVPEVVEGWALVWRVLPERVLFECTGILLDLLDMTRGGQFNMLNNVLEADIDVRAVLSRGEFCWHCRSRVDVDMCGL